MGKLRMGVLVTGGVLGLIFTPGAWAATGAGRNSGDVWLDSARSTQAGHETDPNLACQDIALWGSGLADGSGTYTLDGWSPSGSHELDYQGTWSYSATGARVIATIDVAQLIAQAEAKGVAPAPQGFRFELDLAQGPQRQKTFWVDCPAAGSDGGGSTGGGSNGGGSNGGGSVGGGATGGSNGGAAGAPTGGGAGHTTPGGTTSTGAISTSGVTTSSDGGVVTSIGAVTARHRHRPALHGHHQLGQPPRHLKVRRRHVRAVRVTAPPFTG